ncbi:hypothetical protein SynBIOSU31_01222 [Synechococcus sp. BIOS-U3-1]|nr:hypothetical protein SynBIOSU31_01222 [Synechococcus sp. BIOS-U3-1]
MASPIFSFPWALSATAAVLFSLPQESISALLALHSLIPAMPRNTAATTDSQRVAAPIFISIQLLLHS